MRTAANTLRMIHRSPEGQRQTATTLRRSSMNRIKWYGPTVALLVTVLFVMIAGPATVRRIESAHKDQYLINIRDGLEQSSSLEELSKTFRNVAQLVEPSVVFIQVASKQTVRRTSGMSEQDLLRRFFGPRFNTPGDPFNNPQDPLGPQDNNPQQNEDFDKYNVPRTTGAGSGWVYDKEGHIITNNHVVEDADEITVKFVDGTTKKATVVGTDPKTDVAVIKVDMDKDDLHPAKLADENVQQGDIVFAFGAPFQFDFSMSQGIVSGKGRRLNILSDVGGYENFIQTDAAINPGNSGGPLTNVYGQVVGMNSAIASRTGAFNGLGFAIPIDMVKSVADQILKSGKVSRGFLGIVMSDQDLDPKLAATFGFEGKGVLVTGADPQFPAAKAGIERGDIVTKVDGKPVQTQTELRNMIAAYPPGATVKLDVFRKGQTKTIPVTLAEMPDTYAVAGSSENPTQSNNESNTSEAGQQALRKIGIEGATDLTPELAKRMNTTVDKGVVVLNVRPGSVAQSVGIQRGSIITEVGDSAVSSVEQLAGELAKADLKKGVRLSVSDGKYDRYVLIEVNNP
ncbi:MAG: PDZ domain-containing protein [Phycisphaera sp.]|nr:PDZ domain-containing protein [Phycisphaera sp.]